MALSPIPVVAFLLLYFVFVALMFGGEMVEAAMPEAFTKEKGPGEDDGGFFGFINAVTDAIVGIVQMIWGMIVLLVNLLTFNIPTDPPPPGWVRAPVATLLIASIAWSVATLIRGN